MTEPIEINLPEIGEVQGHQISALESRLAQIRRWLVRLRRRFIPFLIWYGDEIDVGVTFKGIGALGGNPGAVWDAQDAFRRMGIGFDTGSGCHGRDWEWDWSLSGPLSVRFRARARNPERRVDEPTPQKPKLKVVA